MPDSITVVSVGDLIAVDTVKNKLIYNYKSDIAKSNFSLCAANYTMQEQTHNNIHIKTFLYPEHKNKNDTLVSLFGRILNYYQERFGKYPFNEFKIVETERRGGYAHEGQMFLSSDIINNIDDKSHFIIAHEVAHQWFPHTVMFFPEYYPNESFAQYASISYMESIGIMNNQRAIRKFLILDGYLNLVFNN